MTAYTRLLPEHNSACERAKLSSCSCFCRGAGHQHDLIKRAVAFSGVGVDTMSQFRSDLQRIYGGFHENLRDAETESRRKVPEGLVSLQLDRGRGATWVETLVLDEAIHAAFLRVADESLALTDEERELRKSLVVELAEGALRAVVGDVVSDNISDGHVWCSILAEVNDPDRSTAASSALRYSRICFPRTRVVRAPRSFMQVREAGLDHAISTRESNLMVPGLEGIFLLMGAASCPDLWHHPAAVRYSLRPQTVGVGWPPVGTIRIDQVSSFASLESRWRARGNW